MALLITQGEHSRREGKMGSLVDTKRCWKLISLDITDVNESIVRRCLETFCTLLTLQIYFRNYGSSQEMFGIEDSFFLGQIHYSKLKQKWLGIEVQDLGHA